MERNNVFMMQVILGAHRKPDCITGSPFPCLLEKVRVYEKVGQRNREASMFPLDVKLLTKEQGLLYHST